MAVSLAFDAATFLSSTISGGATYTFPLTVAAASGQERLVFLGSVVDTNAANDFTACTIGGQTGTRVGSVSLGPDSAGFRAFVTCYRATGTASTSISVVATAGAGYSSYSGYVGCLKLSDAGTLKATTNAAVVDPVLNVNTASGGAAGACVLAFNFSAGASATWTGLTERWDHIQAFSDDSWHGASADIVTGETPRAISVDLVPNPTNSWASIAVSFNPVGAAADMVDAEEESAWLAGGGHLGHATWAARRAAYATAIGRPLT